MSDKCDGCYGKLCSCALGVAFGGAWALGVVILGLLAWWLGHGHEMVNTIASVYWGYAATLPGIAFGALWGFVDGFIGGVVIGWIYNFVVKKCHCKTCQGASGGEKKV